MSQPVKINSTCPQYDEIRDWQERLYTLTNRHVHMDTSGNITDNSGISTMYITEINAEIAYIKNKLNELFMDTFLV
jgi:hypothetical protein